MIMQINNGFSTRHLSNFKGRQAKSLTYVLRNIS